MKKSTKDLLYKIIIAIVSVLAGVASGQAMTSL